MGIELQGCVHDAGYMTHDSKATGALNAHQHGETTYHSDGGARDHHPHHLRAQQVVARTGDQEAGTLAQEASPAPLGSITGETRRAHRKALQPTDQTRGTLEKAAPTTPTPRNARRGNDLGAIVTGH